MSLPVLARIVEEVASIACIKLESLPTLSRIAALRATWSKNLPSQGPVPILTGLGALYVTRSTLYNTDFCQLTALKEFGGDIC